MKLARLVSTIVLFSAFLPVLWHAPAYAQDTLLAGWERAPDGTVMVGDDFDPQLDGMLTCSGCWFHNGAGSGATYSQSTTNGVTQGSGALEIFLVGKGNGGEYTFPINGVDVNLDTHFDNPMIATYSNTTNAAAGGPDPRYDAIKAAVDGNQDLYTLDFDITYDIASMRAIPWQPPEETVDPVNNGQYPQRFFWMGMYGNANDPNGTGFIFTGFDQNNINPFDAQWDDNMFPVFEASFPLSAFEFQPESTLEEGQTPTAFYTFGLLYNSVFGTSPAGSNTEGINVYIDNFRLSSFDPREVCDLNADEDCTLTDFELFMGQHLVAEPTLGDFDEDGDNDFIDFQEFESNYDTWLEINGGGSLAAQLAGVPEPATTLLASLGAIALLAVCGRCRPAVALVLAVGLSMGLAGRPADAQIGQITVVDSFKGATTNWAANPGAAQNANPTVGRSTTGATNGTMSLIVTQAEDTIGDADFSWNANTIPNWTAGHPAFEALAAAVNLGAEHFNLLADVTFDPSNTFDVGVNTMTVTLGLDFVGQTIGTYAGEAEQFTTTATIPLTNFGLQDVEDEGVASYSAQIGFTADALQFAFGAYVDNIRLEQISEPDLLTLEIDRADGTATLMNLTANPIAWDYIEIKSPAGSLDANGWDSLDDQNADGAGTWIEAGGSSATALVEASLLGTHTLMPSGTLSLGALFSGGAEDVDLEIRRAGGPSFRTYDQLVTYVGESGGVLGDYNDDGIVNAADYVAYRNALAGGGSLLNEGMTPGVVDQEDYDFWVSRFGATSGSGSASATSVPEPSAVCLLICTLVGLLRRRR